MSSTTPATLWFRNTEHGTLHEVEAKSALARRLRGEMREQYDRDEDGNLSEDPTFVKAYEPVTPAELKKALESPETVPGYPAGREQRRADAAAAKARQASRDEAMDAIITGQVAPQGGLSEDEVQARIDKAVADALAKITDPAKAEPTTPKGK